MQLRPVLASSSSACRRCSNAAAGAARLRRPTSDDDTKKNESGTFALHTLKDNETIARLATGIKRFELPDEFNFIKIYQQIAAEPKTGYGEQACEQLAADVREPPAVSQGGRALEGDIDEVRPGPRTTGSSSGSTRSSATGAASRHVSTQPAGARGDGRLPLPQRQEGHASRPTRSRSTSCSTT